MKTDRRDAKKLRHPLPRRHAYLRRPPSLIHGFPPVGFSAIRLSFELDTDADDEQLAKLRKLTERYCVVYQTLAATPTLSTTLSSQ